MKFGIVGIYVLCVLYVGDTNEAEMTFDSCGDGGSNKYLDWE